ncbi:hypothetical protein [Micromonospora sp. LOL_024]|uniref:hypothetical protein n=1 Tax=Micromonospora sp. LOL_024 TaxID=3345412 RepID=UPI003A888D38
MSAIASFHKLSQADLPELVAAADPASGGRFNDVIESSTHDLGHFDWSGYLMVYLLEYLHRTGVLRDPEFGEAERLLTDAAGVGAYLLTLSSFADMERLDPAQLPEADIRSFFNTLGVGFSEAGRAARDGVRALAQHLRGLDDDQILLVLVV